MSQPMQASILISADNSQAKPVLKETKGDVLSLGSSADRSGAQVERMSKRLSGGVSAQRRMGLAVQNASYQIGDFAVQVGMGTDAMRAMSMQLPQLLGGFGVWGAAAGAAVAIGGALAPMFLDQGQSAKTLSQNLSDLEGTVSNYRDAIKSARSSTSEIISEFGSASIAVRTLLEDFEEFSQKRARRQLNSAVAQFSNDFNHQEDFRVFLKMGNVLNGLYGLTAQQTAQVDALNHAFTRLGNAQGPAEQARAFERARTVLEQVLATSENVTDEQEMLVEKLFKAQIAAEQLAGAMGGVGDEIAKANAVLDGLTTKIAKGGLSQIGLDAQLSALQNGANKQQAKIAGNLAQRRSELSPLINSGNASDSQKAAAALAQYESQLKKAADTEAKIKAIHDERAKALKNANKTSRSAAKSAEKLADANLKALQVRQDGIAKVRLEMALIGQSNTLRRRQLAILSEVQAIKRAGLSVEDKISKQRIKAAAEQADLTSELERQKDAWGRVQRAGEGVIDTLFDFDRLAEGDFDSIFKDIVSDLGQTAMDMAVKNPLKNALLGTNYGSFGDLMGGGMQAGAMNVSTPMVNLSGAGVAGLSGGYGVSGQFSSAGHAVSNFATSTDAATQNLGILGQGFHLFGQALSGLPMGGSGGGLLGGLANIFTSAFGGFFGGSAPVAGTATGYLYSNGGYTGAGAKDTPAGIVHKGEVVWSQRDIARAGGVSVVEAMRLGRRGYAAGGIVGAANAYWPQAANNNAPVQSNSRPTIQIINNSSAQVTGEMEESTDSQGQRSYKFMLADAVGDAMAVRGGKANRLMRQSGVRQRGARR